MKRCILALIFFAVSLFSQFGHTKEVVSNIKEINITKSVRIVTDNIDKTSDCKIPFTLNEKGHRVYKQECLGY